MINFSPVCSGMLLMIIRITWINNSQCAYSVVFSTCCAQFNIIATVVMDTSFGQHGIILCIRFPQDWAVVGKYNQFCFALLLIFRVCLYPSTYFSLFISS